MKRMTGVEKALTAVGLLMFGAAGFAWSAPILTPGLLLGGWIAVATGALTLAAVATGRWMA